MHLLRTPLALLVVALLGLSTAACEAEGNLDEGGAGVQVEGEGEGGEGGDD